MNVLFFGYWGANEGLSQATINPHLEILASFDQVEKIIYVTIERTKEQFFQVPTHSKIQHHPYHSPTSLPLISKAFDFTLLPLKLVQLINKEKIDLLMCRSSLAGGIGYWAHRWSRTPFTVESFEPHADYMAELGIWSSKGISYRLQKHLEEKQKKHALHLMPVSNAHKNRLIEEGILVQKISVMPCAVDHEKFVYSEKNRKSIRDLLEIPDMTTVGIYVGKFGGIYWDEKAFKLFKLAFEEFEGFHLIILSPQPHGFIQDRCKQFEIPLDQIHHTLVAHENVPHYLSAADFAFSLHSPSGHSYAFSPIKNGEYWANGLPIVSPDDIGDDSNIIANEKGGIPIQDFQNIDWTKLKQLIVPNRIQHIVELSKKYRNLQIVINNYKALVNQVPYIK